MKRTGKKFKSIIIFLILTMIMTLDFTGIFSVVAKAAVVLNIEQYADKSSVSTGEVFTYTIKYSIPSHSDIPTNVVIRDVLDDKLEYVSYIDSPDIERVEVDGNEVKFFFKDLGDNTGISGIVRVSAKFKPGITLDKVGGNPNIASNIPTIESDGEIPVPSNEVIVTPKLNESNWDISKIKVIPNGGVIPALDQPIKYEIKVNSNSGVGQLNLENVRVEDTIPVGSEYISSSDNGVFADGKVTWNIGNLNLGQSATRYVTIKYPSTTFTNASSVTNTANVYAELFGSDVELNKLAEATHAFNDPVFSVGNFSKTGRQSDDRYSLGQTAKFYLGNITNTGNVPLDTVTIEDDIPEKIKLSSITTGSYSSAVDVSIEYKTNKDDFEQWVGSPFTSPNNTTLQVLALALDVDEYITDVRWVLTAAGGIPAGFTETNDIRVFGTFQNAVLNDTITNSANLTAKLAGQADIVKSSSKDVSIIEEMPWLNASKSVKGGQVSFNYNDEVEYIIRIENDSLATGDYVNPIAIDTLHSELENVTTTGWDKGNSSIINAPTIDNTGGKLKWVFDGTLKPGEYVEAYYKAKIKDLTIVGSITNDIYITTDNTDQFENASELENDISDLDEDGKLDDKLAKSSNQIFIKFRGSVVAKKFVKGELDADWGHFLKGEGYGQTVQGGLADYKIELANTGANGPISNLVIIDILPFVGDTGVVDLGSRGTEWRPYLVNKIIGKVIRKGGVEEALPVSSKIYYSINSNPSKAELKDPLTGVPDSSWDINPPEDITSVQSLKFDFGDLQLNTEDKVVVEWPMRAPVGAPADKIAWNSFGYGATYEDLGKQEPFLESEPLKVGFMMHPYEDGELYLGNCVWEDMNKNGIQDDGNTGINGVLVNLYFESDTSTPLKYTRTGLDQNGNPGYYLFPKLSAGNYIVEFVYPNKYKVSPEATAPEATLENDTNINNTGTINIYSDNGVNKNSIKTNIITIADNDLSIDAGLYQLSSIGDKVWNDKDADGIQDSGESGIEGVTVRLLDKDGNVAKYVDYNDANNLKDVPNQITDASGNYKFQNLEPGDYKVEFTNPGGNYKFTLNNKGAIDTDNDPIAAGDGLTATTGVITLKSVEENLDIDAGMYLGQIGDFVWDDKDADGIQDSNGISGVTVNLYIDGQPGIFKTTTTNSGGAYLFDELLPKDYIVEFVKPGDYNKYSPQNQGADTTKDSDADRISGRAAVIALSAGERNLTIDAGMYKLASIGNFVWHDLNANGRQDDGGIGVAGVKVELLDKDGNPVALDDNNNAILELTTAADGAYLFQNLKPGDYKLKFTLPNTQLKYSDMDVGENTGDSDVKVDDVDATLGTTLVTTLTSGENDLRWDAGIHRAIIGDYVWHDLNANGIQDSGEPGIPNVTVTLTDNLGSPVNDADGVNLVPIKTDANGKYEFNNLLSGDYIVHFEELDGYDFSPKDNTADDGKDSDADITTGKTDVSLGAGQVDRTSDAGLYMPASIGDYLWEDVNGNGIQDVGELGINDVTVELYKEGVGAAIDTDTTVDNGGNPGYYKFENLVPGNYYIKFELPAGYNKFISPNSGADDAKDSDVDISIDGTTRTAIEELTSGEDNIFYDAGVYKYVSIGDRVWEDLNLNGIQDDGEPNFKDVNVKLYKKNGLNFEYLKEQDTDVNGEYLFDKLAPGEYKVKFTSPNGYALTLKNSGADTGKDSDVYKADGLTDPIVLASGINTIEIDAGLYKLAKIGNKVWNDENGNGIQDDGENGIEDVDVKLYNSSDLLVDSTKTNIMGLYTFENIEPGDYYLVFTKPSNYTVSTKDTSSTDDTKDSDVDESTMKTIITTLDSGEEDFSWDMGLFKLASIGDYVWHDLNANGIQDAGEPALSGVTVNLYDTDNKLVATKTTGVDGKYIFGDLKFGNYFVEFILDGYVISPKERESDISTDSNANTNGKTDSIALTIGQQITTIDTGLYQLASLGDKVWKDINGNGIQDIGETPVEGVVVNLLDKNGIVLATKPTDSEGKYLFSNLIPGDYIVAFQKPEGTFFTLKDSSGADGNDSDADEITGKTQLITLTSGDNNLTLDAGIFTPGIQIEKTVYVGHDGGIGTGKELVAKERGTEITFIFKVTNVGEGYLNNVEITDAKLGIHKSHMTLISGTEPLAPGASLTYYYESKINGDFVNTASTTAIPTDDKGTTITNTKKPTDDDNAQVNDLNDVHVAPQKKPGIKIEKTVYEGKFDANNNGQEKVTLKEGSLVTYLFIVTNTGNTYLNNISLVDENLNINRSNMTKVRGKEPLAPGQTMIFHYESTINGDLVNRVSASGTPTDLKGNIIPNTGIQKDDDIAEVEALGSIGNYIWHDKNHDGIQDSDEEGFANVKVILIDSTGNKQELLTDSQGKYLFDNLPSGEYTIEVDGDTIPLENLKVTYELDDEFDNIVKVNLGDGEIILNVDFGYVLRTTEKQEHPTKQDNEVKGKIEKGEKIKEVKEEPKYGKVEISESEWEYIPDDGYHGEDEFSIIVEDEDGYLYELIIDIPVEEIPYGSANFLPKTGSPIDLLVLSILGLISILFGAIFIAMSKTKKRISK